MGRALAEHGLGLHNQGDIDEQAIVGATSTGTHGTGERLQSWRLFGAQPRRANGDLLTVNEHENAEFLPAMQLSLGAFGVALDVTLDVRPAYRLRESSWYAPLAEVIPQIDALAANHRHFEFFWAPHSDRAQVKLIDETDDQPVYPVGQEGERKAEL
ncbi:MAG: D-arabinono-1,4-lactone oxidase [Acidimicrobiales bacterium]